MMCIHALCVLDRWAVIYNIETIVLAHRFCCYSCFVLVYGRCDVLFCVSLWMFRLFFFFKQKTAYEMRISDWSSDVCSSDLGRESLRHTEGRHRRHAPGRERHGRAGELVKGDRPTGEDHDREEACNEAGGQTVGGSAEHRKLLRSNRIHRSEEVRVGKELVSRGRSRWSADH